MRLFLILLLVLVVFIFSITLGANNDQIVTFNFLIAKGEYRLSTLLACLFGGGFVIGWLVSGLFYLRASLQLSSAQRKLKKLRAKYSESSLAEKPSSSDITS